MTKTAKLRLELFNTDSPQNPTEFSGWTIHTFGLDKITDTDRDEYVKERTGRHSAVPANNGLLAKLKAGTAFWLSYYEHSEGSLSLMGEGNNCQWDSTGLAGIMLWDEPSRKLKGTKEERAAAARDFLEMYNKWANGYVYSFRLTEADDENGDPIDGQDECYDEKAMFDAIRLAAGDRPVIVEGEADWLMQFFGDGLKVVDEDDE